MSNDSKAMPERGRSKTSGEPLSAKTSDAFRARGVALNGSCAAPAGKHFLSVNVAHQQGFDLSSSAHSVWALSGNRDRDPTLGFLHVRLNKDRLSFRGDLYQDPPHYGYGVRGHRPRQHAASLTICVRVRTNERKKQVTAFVNVVLPSIAVVPDLNAKVRVSTASVSDTVGKRVKGVVVL